MKLEEELLDVEVTGQFETQGFNVKLGAKAFEMISARIYTNRQQAVIREYSTNAWDAHVEAGNTDPFDVHLPTTLAPYFAVRDYGTGMTHEHAMHTFTTYFDSTKTTSNDVTGCLGLGSKSGFSIADSFVVTSWRDGKKRTYNAYMDSYKIPQFSLLTEEDSDEPTGVEVRLSIPSWDQWRFRQEAIQVYSFFKVKPIINAGKLTEVTDAIESAFDDYTIKGEGFISTGRAGGMRAVMGNVCYDIPSLYDEDNAFVRSFNKECIFYFDIGDLNFNPGRETLDMDEKTRKNVLSRVESVRKSMVGVVEKNLAKCDNYFDAKVMYDSTDVDIRPTNAKYKGESLRVPPHFKAPVTYMSRTWSRKYETNHTTQPSFDLDKTTYFWNKKGMVTRLRNYIAEQQRNSAYSTHTVYLIEKEDANVIGLPHDLVKNPEDLPKPTVTRSSKRDKEKLFKFNGEVNYGQKSRRSWTSEEVDLTDGVGRAYVEISRFQPKDYNGESLKIKDLAALRAACNDFDIECEIYGCKTALVNQKRFKKSAFTHAQDYFQKELRKKCKGKKFIAPIDNGIVDFLRNLKKQGLDSERVNDIILRADSVATKSQIQTLRNFGFDSLVDNTLEEDVESFIADHPLMEASSHHYRARAVSNREYMRELNFYIEAKENASD